MYGEIDGKVIKDKLNQHKPPETTEPPTLPENDPLFQLRATYANKQVGDRFEFGRYPQGANGEVRPITWRVLRRDSDSLLVISEKGLDTKRYNDVEVSFWKSIFGSGITWSNCTLRAWLNGEFYGKAFNEQEQSLIKKTIIANNAGPSTEDNVFLLSIDEAKSLFIGCNDSLRDPMEFIWSYEYRCLACADRICNSTEYAIKNGAWVYSGNVWWWLRSRGYNYNRAAFVCSIGKISNEGHYVSHIGASIRPALKLAI